jgi:DNA-binding CsgD family transcriptional regulator
VRRRDLGAGAGRVHSLYGRDHERSRIEGCLERARCGHGSVLCLVGEPGAGKTVLCDAAAVEAVGFQVVRAVCVEGEADLPLAALSLLLRALLPYAERLPRCQRQVIDAAMGSSSKRVADRLALGVSTLGLLAAAALERPLLVLVDDAQWLDAASQDAMSFALRRLDADAAAVIVATRPGAPLLDRLPRFAARVVLTGLAPSDALNLLRDHFGPDITAQVAAALVAASSGIPLALIEIADELTSEQRRGAIPMAEPPPIGPRLTGIHRQRLAPLPLSCRLALAVVAAAGSAVELVAPALESLGSDVESLQPAEVAGVVVIGARGVEFCHPLLRSAVLELLDPAQRRRVHRTLAAAAGSDPERHAAHLAAASVGPSETVARALLASACVAERRGGLSAAAAVLERAASATPTGPVRLERLVMAAQALMLAGRPEAATRCAEEVVAAATDPLVRADATLIRNQIMMWGPKACEVAEIIRREAPEMASLDPARAQIGLIQAGIALSSHGEITSFVTLTEQAYALMPADTNRAAISLILADALVLSGRRGEALALIQNRTVERCIQQADEIEADDRLLLILCCASQSLTWCEQHDQAQRLAQRIVDSCRRNVMPSALAYPSSILSEVLWWRGLWAEASCLGEEAVALAAETGQVVLGAFAAAVTARVLAGQGDEVRCRYLAGQAIEAARTFGAPPARLYALCALGLLELGLGHPSEAARILRQADDIRIQVGLGETTVVPYGADFIEALIRVGELDAAREALRYHRSRAEDNDSPWTRSTAARCSALLATGHEADRLFTEALGWYPAASFEGARTQLYWGEQLRRRRAVAHSRELLHEAATTFDHLGARPWFDRARAELRAAGARDESPRKSANLSVLTSQELQIAVVVSKGMTNREAAAALFVSPKTIEYHLGKVYAKLNVASRCQLAHLLAIDEVDNSAPQNHEVRASEGILGS